MISAHSPSVQTLSAWAWFLPPLLGLAVASVTYALGMRRLMSKNSKARPQRRHISAFFAGIASIGLALLSPLDSLAEALFSAHMVQHLVIVLLAAPLLVYGRPFLPFAVGTPRSIRRRITGVKKGSAGRRLSAFFLKPLPVGLMHATVLWIWHLPGPYQAAIVNPPAHYAEHASFFVTALLFWRLVLEPGLASRYLQTILLVLGTALQSGALGAVLAFATFELYPVHVSSSAEMGVSALEDQQLAGAIMWIPAGGIYLMTILGLLLKAFRDMDRRMPAGDLPVRDRAAEPLVEAGGRP